MNYTEKYHLPQWAEEDRILMADFNEAMEKIENGMQTAQGAADKLPYAVGRYAGNGGTQEIAVGFRPGMVMVGCIYTASAKDQISTVQYLGITTGGHLVDRMKLTDNGFQVIHIDSANGFPYPMVNQNGRNYFYVAFR